MTAADTTMRAPLPDDGMPLDEQTRSLLRRFGAAGWEQIGLNGGGSIEHENNEQYLMIRFRLRQKESEDLSTP